MENELQKIQIGTDIRLRATLTDSGVAVDWTTVTVKAARVYSMAQNVPIREGVSFSPDAEDPKILLVDWAAGSQCYKGDYSLIVAVELAGRTATFTAPAFQLVPLMDASQTGVSQPTQGLADIGITLSVESIDTALIRQILDDCIAATGAASQAAADISRLEQEVEEAEALRVSAEQKRATAEKSRQSAETSREQAETRRQENETARQQKETERQTAETARAEAEQERVSAEQSRVTAEEGRATAEAARTQAEQSRVSAEQSRVQNENKRIAEEQVRVSAEASRKQAEALRQQNTAAAIEAAETATAEANTAKDNANTAAANAQKVANTYKDELDGIKTTADAAQPKEEGKALSTNDYSNEEKAKVADALVKSAQTLTEEEKGQVQGNIGLKSTVDVVGAGEVIEVPLDNVTKGFYREAKKNGEPIKSVNNNAFYSAPIQVRRGDVFFIKITTTSLISVITSVDNTGKALSTEYQTTETDANFSYFVNKDGYISISGLYSERADIRYSHCELVGFLAKPAGGYPEALYKAVGATWDNAKGVWLFNELELTNEEMAEVYTFGNLANSDGDNWRNRLVGYKGKTTIPYNQQIGALYNSNLILNCAFGLCSNLEILKISKSPAYPSKMDFAFVNSTKLRKVVTPIYLTYCTSAIDMAVGTKSLEFIGFYSVKISLSFPDSPNLSVEDDGASALAILVENAKNTGPITVTLHPDAFARVPESLIQKATAKQISIASA